MYQHLRESSTSLRINKHLNPESDSDKCILFKSAADPPSTRLPRSYAGILLSRRHTHQSGHRGTSSEGPLNSPKTTVTLLNPLYRCCFKSKNRGQRPDSTRVYFYRSNKDPLRSCKISPRRMNDASSTASGDQSYRGINRSCGRLPSVS